MVWRFKSRELYRPGAQFITRRFLIDAVRSLTAMLKLYRFILIRLLCSRLLPVVARAVVQAAEKVEVVAVVPGHQVAEH